MLRCAAPTGDPARAAGQPLLARSYERLDIDRMREEMADSLRGEIERAVARRRETSDRALPRLTRERKGGRQIVDEPPLITQRHRGRAEELVDGLDAYLETLRPFWRG